jgi:cytoskeletal protein CcmA (bactofilin family)
VTIGSDSIISGDLYVAGSSIEIDGTVMGTVHIYGGSVIIKGKVGAVSAKVQSLELKKDAIVHHNLTYSAPIGATIDNGANILGKTKYTKSSGSKNEASRLGLDFVLALGKILLLGLLIMLWPKFWNIALDKFQKSPLANFGWGLVAIIAAPLVLIALLATAIGIPIALISGLVWITLLYIGSLASKLYVGSFLAKLITKNEAHRVSWLSASLGIIAIGLIEFIPVLGPIFNGILTIMGIGALTALLFTLRRSR